MSRLENSRILVTGGAGFIGSALIWELNERGHDNILVSDFLGDDEKYKNLIPLKFDDYLEADALIQALIHEPELFDDIKYVFHLGANSSTTETDCRHLIENNYEYTKVLAKWALSKNIRFIYASSAATYGDGSNGMDDTPLEGIAKLRPLNMYGYSKHLFDLHAYRHGYFDKLVGLKYFNVFGPNESHKGDMRSVAHKAYEQISNGGKVQLFKSYHPDYADGEQQRDFLYVKDAVRMTLALAENDKAAGLFNLGSGEANTWLDLVAGIFTALGIELSVEFIEMPEELRDKYQYFTQASINSLRQYYEQDITVLKDAVIDYVENYLMPDKRLGD